MYQRFSVLSSSEPVLSVLHAASGSAERHFAWFTSDVFFGLLPVLPSGLIPCVNKDPVMTSSLMLRDGVSAHRRLGNRSVRAVGWKNDARTVISADLGTSNQQLGHLKRCELVGNYE